MPAKIMYINSEFWICIWTFKALKLVTASYWLKAIKGLIYTFWINISPNCHLSKPKFKKKKGNWVFTRRKDWSKPKSTGDPPLTAVKIRCWVVGQLDPKQGSAPAKVRLCSRWVMNSHSSGLWLRAASPALSLFHHEPFYFFSKKTFLPIDV